MSAWWYQMLSVVSLLASRTLRSPSLLAAYSPSGEPKGMSTGQRKRVMTWHDMISKYMYLPCACVFIHWCSLIWCGASCFSGQRWAQGHVNKSKKESSDITWYFNTSIYLMHASVYSNVHLHGVMRLVSLVRQSESVPWPKLPMKTEMDPAFKDKPQINTF